MSAGNPRSKEIRLHVGATEAVIPYVRVCALLALCCVCAPARDLASVLDGVEARYNRVKTLQVDFSQKYTAQGRTRNETGVLLLRKPGRMRWDYAAPAGKMLVSDGKWLYFYSPTMDRAEKTPLKNADDYRAPLAFLLGKLDFRRDFGEFELRENGDMAVVTAFPKSDRLPYTRVEFTVTPDNRISRLAVQGVDQSAMEFEFRNESVNPMLAEGQFRFTVPPGIPLVETTNPGEVEKY